MSDRLLDLSNQNFRPVLVVNTFARYVEFIDLAAEFCFGAIGASGDLLRKIEKQSRLAYCRVSIIYADLKGSRHEHWNREVLQLR